jgi:hypothetical protein
MPAAQTTKVKITSIGVKCPDMTFAQPRRDSQMKVISTSQMTKHGSDAHFAISRPRSPITIGNHNGRGWTAWRKTRLLAAPTMYKATSLASAQ